MSRYPAVVLIVLTLLFAMQEVRADLPPTISVGEFTFSSTFDGTGPLYAKAVYPQNGHKLPIMIVQHGYFGHRNSVLLSAIYMAEQGYFCVCVDTRGWGGSAGKHDEGGLEIMDIYDGLQAAIAKFPKKVDPTRVSIVGYSNGGANVFFSAVRFPYLYRDAMAFFGIPDYGMWTKLPASAPYRTYVYQAVGGTPDEVPDKYLVRNSALAAGNLCSGMRFHMAYDIAESICPGEMDEAFTQAAKAAGAPNIFVDVSGKNPGDFRITHGYNTFANLWPTEKEYLDDIAQSNAAMPKMPDHGELTALGFLVTPKFTCILGAGDDAAAKVNYTFTRKSASFKLVPMTSNPYADAVLTLINFPAPRGMQVLVNGQPAGDIPVGAPCKVKASLNATVEFVAK